MLDPVARDDVSGAVEALKRQRFSPLFTPHLDRKGKGETGVRGTNVINRGFGDLALEEGSSLVVKVLDRLVEAKRERERQILEHFLYLNSRPLENSRLVNISIRSADLPLQI